MKKGQWLISIGTIGIIGTILGRLLGPISIGLPFDPSIAFEGFAPQLTAGITLILIGLFVRKRAIDKGDTPHDDQQPPSSTTEGLPATTAPGLEKSPPNMLRMLCFILCAVVLAFGVFGWRLHNQAAALSAQKEMLEEEISVLTNQNTDLNELVSALKNRLRVVQKDADRYQADLYALSLEKR